MASACSFGLDFTAGFSSVFFRGAMVMLQRRNMMVKV
jgi:hypothetical protein